MKDTFSDFVTALKTVATAPNLSAYCGCFAVTIFNDCVFVFWLLSHSSLWLHAAIKYTYGIKKEKHRKETQKKSLN